jgi:transposase
MLQAYKFRLYPNKTTEDKLQWVLDRCRELYNAALQERKEAYKYAGKSISKFEQMRDLTEIKAAIRPEYQDIGSHVLQDVLKRLDTAMQNLPRCLWMETHRRASYTQQDWEHQSKDTSVDGREGQDDNGQARRRALLCGVCLRGSTRTATALHR